jgi:two-component system nitrogen regulation sensor histidine kinase NtrY
LDVVSGQTALFAGKRVDIGIKVDDANSRYETLCDAGLVRQALTNLLQNAIDSLEEHAVSTPHVEIALTRSADSITLTVIDNGPGFPDMNLDNLLEPYVTTRQKGTGLGLAIVSKIMEDHSGTLHLGKAASGGALVSLTFPLPLVHSEDKGARHG